MTFSDTWFHVTGSTAWAVGASVDALLLLDTFSLFRTGFVRDGELFMDAKTIAHHYLTTWLLIDVLSSLPPSLVAVGFSDASRQVQVNSMEDVVYFWRFFRINPPPPTPISIARG